MADWIIQNHNNKLAADVFMHVAAVSKTRSITDTRGKVVRIQPAKSSITMHEAVEPFEAVIVELYEDLAALVSNVHTLMSHGVQDAEWDAVCGMGRGERVWVFLIKKLEIGK